MKAAVVILNWNGRKLLEQFLPSVVNFSGDATIYVADNNSTDDSVKFLQSNYPAIKLIQNKRNLGYASGYNLALKSVSEEIVVLLNSDVEVSENWLEPILKTFQQENEVAAIQPKFWTINGKNISSMPEQPVVL